MKHQLDFEKPIIELQHKLEDLRKNPDSLSLGISFDVEIKQIELKIEETRRQIFLNLTAWQRVQLARHPKRPYTLDYIRETFSDFHELHGDRLYAEDRAIVAGFAKIGDHRVLVLGTQKGRDTKENILRNFGSAHPEGYRKAMRLMRLADKFGLPIITLIDTAGAYPGIGAEERHIAEAIAVNLREMTLLEVPIIACVIGEGGSGGALGIGVADRVLILENAYYSVISPEGCAAILWKERAAAAKAAAALKITAKDLLELKLVDEIIPEPLGGAHNDPMSAAWMLKEHLLKHLTQLVTLPRAERLKSRYEKFRNHGHYLEQPPTPAEKEATRKPSRKPPAKAFRWLRLPDPIDRRRQYPSPIEPRKSAVLYPLTFRPIFKERVWGGRSLARLYGKQLPANRPIGESWEISDRPGDASVIINGHFAGKNLRWLMENHCVELLGHARSLDGRFPLLIKLLDAQEKLSLQVHPPAQQAARLGGEPKTELWHVAYAAPDAELFVGLKQGVTRAEFERKLDDGSVADCFHRIGVRSGDTMFLPSGRVHAIGAGLVIFEIQQNSDTTYRVFDWNRTGLDGHPRELHVAESLASIDFNDFEPSLVQSEFLGDANDQRRKLVQDALFTAEHWRFVGGADTRLKPRTMQIVASLNGYLHIGANGGTVELSPGGFCLVPACLDVVTLQATTAANLLWVEAA